MKNKLRISWIISSIVYIFGLILFGNQLDENIFYPLIIVGAGLFFWGGLLYFIKKKIWGKKKPLMYSTIKLSEQNDSARGISVLLVALRWDSNPISKQEL